MAAIISQARSATGVTGCERPFGAAPVSSQPGAAFARAVPRWLASASAASDWRDRPAATAAWAGRVNDGRLGLVAPGAERWGKREFYFVNPMHGMFLVGFSMI